MASWIRLLRTEIRKILIANNIRQSSWGSIDLGSEKEMNAGRERKRDAEFFGGSLPEREMSMAGQFSPLLASSLLHRLLISTAFHPSDRLFSRGNGYVFL